MRLLSILEHNRQYGCSIDERLLQTLVPFIAVLDRKGSLAWRLEKGEVFLNLLVVEAVRDKRTRGVCSLNDTEAIGEVIFDVLRHGLITHRGLDGIDNDFDA